MSTLASLIDSGDVEGVEAWVDSLDLESLGVIAAQARVKELTDQYKRLEARKIELEAKISVLDGQIEDSMDALREMGIESIEDGVAQIESMVSEVNSYVDRAEEAIAKAEKAMGGAL